MWNWERGFGVKMNANRARLSLALFGEVCKHE